MQNQAPRGLAGPGLLITLALSLASCSTPTEVNLNVTPGAEGTPAPTATVPTPLPPPPTTLTVCLGQEPASLYLYSDLRLYADSNREADVVLQAIYDGPIDILGYQPQAVILERIPSLASGDARVEAVSVSEGDLYLNPESLLPDQLEDGQPYLPSGCSDQTCVLTYHSGEVSLDRLAVDFHLLPDIRWSDGEPVTAADSVYSFSLDADGHTPTGKYLVNRTYTYEALDALTARWTGIPGFLDSEYSSNFWSPLPEHTLGSLSPADLLTAEESNRNPLGWGPYAIEEWRPGEQILLHRNLQYFRAAEGLPRFDYLIFRFVGNETASAVQQLLTGECDVVDETALSEADLSSLLDLEQSGQARIASTPGALLERMDFNLDPVGAASIAPLDNLRFRRAIAGCIDRQGFVDEVLGGLGALSDTYLPPDHPYYSAPSQPLVYDPAAAAAELEAMGWVDEDADPQTPRVARGVAGIHLNTPLSFAYLTTPGTLHQSLAEHLQEGLGRCGVELEVEIRDPSEVMAPWPDGPAFGRTFDTVDWAWLTMISPPCEMFARREIASDRNPYGINASAFSDPAYDRACSALLLGMPETEAYREGARFTQETFASQLPAIPLFLAPRIAASGPGVCGLAVDPSAYSVLWNLEELGSGEMCGGG